MVQRRSYNEYCGIAKALDLVGERWTLLIVRNLLLGPLRYSELLHGLPGITTNLLAKRLCQMQKTALIEQVRGTQGDSAHSYRLTPLGQSLEPTLHALGRWGWQFLGEPSRKEHRSFEWLLVALRREYQGGAELRAEVVADGVPYTLALSKHSVDISRGGVREPDLRIRGTGRQLAQLFLSEAAKATKGLEVEGPQQALRTLTSSFALPRRSVQN